MIFETLYDIRQVGCRDWFLTPAALLLLILAWVSWRKGTIVAGGGTGPPAGLVPVVFIALTLLSFFATWGQYWTLRQRLERGEALALQGIVSDFQPAPGYKGTERFTLGGQEFSYSRFATQQGFHTLAADGGPVVKGACIRLMHIGNHILRLEVGKTTPGKSGDSCIAGSS